MRTFGEILRWNSSICIVILKHLLLIVFLILLTIWQTYHKSLVFWCKVIENKYECCFFTDGAWSFELFQHSLFSLESIVGRSYYQSISQANASMPDLGGCMTSVSLHLLIRCKISARRKFNYIFFWCWPSCLWITANWNSNIFQG